MFGTKLKKLKKRGRNFFSFLGPGLITGASDDDPAGIAIYSQAGASTGYSLLWTAPFLIPFMIGVQEMCARIGMVTGKGLIGAMRKFYPRALLWIIASAVFFSNTLNVGADLAAMAATTQLVFPLDTRVTAVFYAVLVLLLLSLFSYKQIAQILKWMTLSLFAYVLATFSVPQDWGVILKNSVLPNISFDRTTFLLLVAIIGTTLSPYLFFWQASGEVEEQKDKGKVDFRRKLQIVSKGQLRAMKEDVTVGMFVSNLVMYFIIATVASTLFRQGLHSVETAEQAAAALRPLAGEAAFLLFAIGIVGTGLLAIPVLAGSAAYAFSELFGLREGFGKPFSRSPVFRVIFLLSTLVGLGFTFTGIPPFRALFLTGIIYGLLAPFLILAILGLVNRKEVMGTRVNGRLSNLVGGAAFVLTAGVGVAALLL